MQFPGLNKGDILENITVEKLVFGGKGLAKLTHPNPDHNGKTIFITGGAIPGSIVNLRVLKKKKRFIEAQILETIQKSPLEKENKHNPYGNSGGWRWINIDYIEQLKIKEEQVKEAFNLIEKKYNLTLNPSPLEEKRLGDEVLFLQIKPSPLHEAYRNKVEFSFGKYISHKEGVEQHFNVGFHKQGEFSKVIDFEGTPLIDEEQNEIFRAIKKFSKTLGLPVYDQKRQEGFFRHLLIRKPTFSEEIMILLSFNPEYLTPFVKGDASLSDTGILDKKNEKEFFRKNQLQKIKDFLISLTQKYTNIKSIYFSHNVNKSDTAIGDLELIYGEKTIKENLLGLTFKISPTSFFQTNSAGAEELYKMVLEFAKTPPLIPPLVRKGNSNSSILPPKRGELEGGRLGTVLDLYGGTGTIGMIFAKAGAKKVISVEYISSASKDGEKNAKLNDLENIEFVNARVENFLGDYLPPPNLPLSRRGKATPLLGKEGVGEVSKADLLIIDPPRAGMHPKALKDILKFETKQIIYVSCNVSTLARDLDYILENSDYKIEKVQAMDMFPHTHHIETVVSLVK